MNAHSIFAMIFFSFYSFSLGHNFSSVRYVWIFTDISVCRSRPSSEAFSVCFFLLHFWKSRTNRHYQCPLVFGLFRRGWLLNRFAKKKKMVAIPSVPLVSIWSLTWIFNGNPGTSQYDKAEMVRFDGGRERRGCSAQAKRKDCDKRKPQPIRDATGGAWGCKGARDGAGVEWNACEGRREGARCARGRYAFGLDRGTTFLRVHCFVRGLSSCGIWRRQFSSSRLPGRIYPMVLLLKRQRDISCTWFQFSFLSILYDSAKRQGSKILLFKMFVEMVETEHKYMRSLFVVAARVVGKPGRFSS